MPHDGYQEDRLDNMPPNEGLVWQNRQLKMTILAYKKQIDELKKELYGQTVTKEEDEKQIEAERHKHINKRFNKINFELFMLVHSTACACALLQPMSQLNVKHLLTIVCIMFTCLHYW